MGYKKLPALAQALIVLESAIRKRWDWIWGG